MLPYNLHRIHFIQKRVHLHQSSPIAETIQQGPRYVDQANAAVCILENNPAYSSVSLMDCSTHLDTTTEHGMKVPMPSGYSPEDKEEKQEVYETIEAL